MVSPGIVGMLKKLYCMIAFLKNDRLTAVLLSPLIIALRRRAAPLRPSALRIRSPILPRSAYQLKDASVPSLNWDEGEAEAEEAVPVAGVEAVPARGTTVPGAAEPAAAPTHP